MENFPYKEVMKLAAKYQEFLNKNEDKVMFICWEKIKPLLDKNFYIEAKKELNNFYKDSYFNGECAFIGRDIILSNINRHKNKEPLVWY